MISLKPEAKRVVLKNHTGGYREYRIPGILPVDGALLLACEARAGKTGDWGDIDVLILRMEPNGDPVEVLKIGASHLPPDGTMRTYNNPVFVPDGDRVHLIYHINYERAFVVSSPDGGRTWGESREITGAYREFPYEWNCCATGPGHGVCMKNGRLVAPVWLAMGEALSDGTRRHWPSVCGCVYSDDHGKTWRAGGLAEGMVNGNETNVAELPDGRLLFNHRSQNKVRRRILSMSADGGETLCPTWRAEELTDPQCFGGMEIVGGTVLFANCDSETKRVDLTVRASDDAGTTWQTLWKVDPMGGYVDAAVLDGRLWLFYERTNYEKDCIIEDIVLTSAVIEAKT